MVSGRNPAALDVLALLARATASRSGSDPELHRRGEASRPARPRESAEALLGAIAAELGIEPDIVAPAYEDPAEWLRQGGQSAGECRSRRIPSSRTPRSATASPAFSRAG